MRKCTFLAAVALALAATRTDAVIVIAPSPNPPANQPGYNSVGQAGVGGAIYMGNGWVLTAWHVGFNTPSVNFGSGDIAAIPNSTVVLRSPSDPSKNSDLVMYRLATDPGVSPVTIASSTPTAGTSVTMVGYGSLTVASTTGRLFDVTVNSDTDWTWTETTNQSIADYAAITVTESGRAKRWGTSSTVNIQDDDGTIAPTVDADFEFLGGGSTRVFATLFTRQDLRATASSGDSGGAVFNAAGQLVGVMDFINDLPDIPADIEVFQFGSFPGRATFSADIAAYRDQITAIIAVPEPTTATLLLPVLPLLLRRTRKAQR